MRNGSLLSAILLTCACGPSEETYAQDFHDKLCVLQWDCQYDLMDDMGCGTTVPADQGDYADCDFDSEKARKCIEAEWTCNTDYAGFEFIEPAKVCNRVYRCGQGEGGG